ncbi:Flp pilus assembly protein CpaB [Humisphaera borealis]|uniref:Flp pilus assembly protein CpaB n=1 Tax=Humisphaera borealis TaxID=2807512 RepID=A0A7M2WUR9_9BACT|nr:Flp pilus assembly protein CpaB [Humisphaera borealis]QOV89268.1 Flp pilus assembly protein CpaB [Humisphaera borealis]
MNVKSFIPLIAAVLLGLIALVVARSALNKSGTAQTKDPVIGIVVATKDLPPGKELATDDLVVTRLPAESMPSGSFRTVQELIGRTTLQPLVKGQSIVEPLLAPTGAKGGLMGLIPSGHRAMTVEVNEFSGLAGMLQPGARVDVVAALRDEKGQSATRTILQNLEVRAVGRNINPAPVVEGAPPPPPSNNVTLLVTPRQAQIMNLATQNGRPWLVLRNNLDKETPDSELVTLAELTSGSGRSKSPQDDVMTPATKPTLTMADIFTSVTPPPSRSAARVVQVIRGGVESTVKFDEERAEHKPAATPATKPVAPPSLFGQGRAITGTDSESKQD